MTRDEDHGVPEPVVAASKAFGTPLRLAIIRHLVRQPLTQAQLARLLDTTDYTIAGSVRVLHETGVIVAPIPAGRRGVQLEVDDERVRALTAALRRYLVPPRN